MNLTEARSVLIDSVLNVPPGGYDAARQDRALQFALQIFIRRTNCNITSSNVTLAAGSETHDFTVDFTDFEPHQIVRCRFGYKPCKLVNANEVIRELDDSATAGRPEMVGWQARNSALFYPIPSADYVTLTVARSAPLVSFTPGTEAEVSLNVPEAFVRDAVWFGASSALVFGESNSMYSSEGWARFEKLIEEVRGLTGLNQGSTWRVRTGGRQYYTEGARQLHPW